MTIVNDAAFFKKGWSYAEPRDQRSATLGLLDDYSKVKLSTDWLQNQPRVEGETRREHILTDTSHVVLNTDHFRDLWNNKEKIPESWKKVAFNITFDGDILLHPRGHRSVLCLYWTDVDNYGWCWRCVRLSGEWERGNPAAVLMN